MKNNKVSIIVPIYNVEQYLNKCIESLINQSYSDIDILLIDDGSPDNSGNLCDTWAKKDSRIEVIHKDNGGYGSVLEFSINHIKNKYFLICDPDDWLEKDCVKTLMETMNKYNTDMVIARKKIVYSDGKIEHDINDFCNLKANIKYNDLIPFLNIPCSPHSKLYKTEFCQNISFPRKVSNTDFLLYQIALSRINSAVYINEELSNYFIDRPGNTFNDDLKFNEKSFKSNSIVTLETMNQLDKNSNIYYYSIINLFVRSCKYVAIAETNNINDGEFYFKFTEVIDYSKKYKKYLWKYLRNSTNSIFRALIKYFVYKSFYGKNKKIGINILRKINN